MVYLVFSVSSLLDITQSLAVREKKYSHGEKYNFNWFHVWLVVHLFCGLEETS